MALTVAEIFHAAGLLPHGPARWETAVNELLPGVYVLSLVADPHGLYDLADVPKLPENIAGKWLTGEPVVYIGRTRRALRKRLAEFYRHKYGNKSPHRGGQAVLLLDPKPWVFWASTNDPTIAERKMIEAFRDRNNAA